MQSYEWSYLSRYILIALLILFVAALLRHALTELRWDMKHRIQIEKDVFLLLTGGSELPRAGSAPELSNGLALGLYHTTWIGSSLFCDIRFTRSGLKTRHALIYRYEGYWFIRPTSRSCRVLLNGVAIQLPTPLEDQDQLYLGSLTFIFTDRRDIVAQAGQIQTGTAWQAGRPAAYTARDNGKAGNTGTNQSVGHAQDVQYGEFGMSSHQSATAWLAVNLFTLLGGLLMWMLTPAELPAVRQWVVVFTVGFLLLTDLYAWLIPLLLRSADRILILVLMQLVFLGLMFQTRFALPSAASLASAGVPVTEISKQVLQELFSQDISLFIGLVLFPLIVVLVARTHILEPLSILCAIATPLLLVATLVFGSGSDTHGATLWISIAGTSIQLTEFAKITYLVVLANFFKIRPSLRNQLVFAVWAALVFMLILLLPDLGSAMILLPTTLIVYVVMTSEYLKTGLILLAGSGMSVLAFSLFPHVQRRITGWTTLWSEVNDNNRQIVYGLQAMVRGGIFGRGLANGSPDGIPLASSDMVFSIVCEELGLLTGLCVVMIFIILWLRAARITLTARDGFTSSLALGIGTLFFIEAAIVIGGTTGLLPLTGATLPLIARGGSSVLAKLILLAMLVGLSARKGEDYS